MKYSDASDPDFAPVLNLKYGATPNAVNEISATAFNIYPNPTTGLLTVESGTEVITNLEVTNLLGEVVLQPKLAQNTINISSLSTGMYLLNITTKNGRTSQRIVKN